MTSNDSDSYNMDNEHRGKFYINIESRRYDIESRTYESYRSQLTDDLVNFKKEIARLGFEAMETPKGIPFKNYITGDLYSGDQFFNNDCIALLYYEERKIIKDEYKILDLFHFTSDHGFYKKPRILFLIYNELEAIPNVRLEAESGTFPLTDSEYQRAIQEDMWIIRAKNVDFLKTIRIFTNTLSTIQDKTDISDFFHLLRKNMEPIFITLYDTTTKRLEIGPKSLPEDNDTENLYNLTEYTNGVLKKLIKVINGLKRKESLENNKKIQEFWDRKQLGAILKSLKENPNYECSLSIDELKIFIKECNHALASAS